MEQIGGVSRVMIEAEETGPDAPEGVSKKGDLPAGEQLKPQDQKPGDEAPQRPEWCPEKFWKDGKVDQEGLAKSYGELEKAKKPADPNAKPDDALKAEQPPQPSNVPGVTADQSTRFMKELTDSGALSEQSYTELEKAGYSKATVDAYLGGIKAQEAAGTALVTEMKGRVGGDEQYTAMTDWMRGNLKPEDIAAYDAAVTSGNRATIELAIDGMHTRYTKSVGSDPNLLSGRKGTAMAGDVYESSAQVSRDMKDPRYKTDDAFRNKVREKIARSNVM